MCSVILLIVVYLLWWSVCSELSAIHNQVCFFIVEFYHIAFLRMKVWIHRMSGMERPQKSTSPSSSLYRCNKWVPEALRWGKAGTRAQEFSASSPTMCIIRQFPLWAGSSRRTGPSASLSLVPHLPHSQGLSVAERKKLLSSGISAPFPKGRPLCPSF